MTDLFYNPASQYSPSIPAVDPLRRTAVLEGTQPWYEIEVDQATTTSWAEMMTLFQDANVYQTWSYGAVRWGRDNLSHLVLKKNGRVAAIAQLRIVQAARLKFGIAYLRWGPMWHRLNAGFDPEIAARFASALHDEYVGRRGLLLKVMPNAFAHSERGEQFFSAFRGITSTSDSEATAYRTLLLDLSPPLDQLRRNLNRKWRWRLSQAEKSNLEVVGDDSIGNYKIFCGIYREMLHRKKFDTSVSIEEFGRIQEDLPRAQRMQTMICLLAGEPVAGLVSSAIGNYAIYLLGATSNKGLSANGSYLLQWTWIQQLKQKGVRWYDLGGIDPKRNPGVHHFKSGLSGVDCSHIPPLVVSGGGFGPVIIQSSEAIRRKIVPYVRRMRALAQ